MSYPKVSLIVPLYNAENFLHKCMESLRNQTLREIEILLVDDGSTDGSGKICDEYAANDPRIKVIHKTKAGVNSARQTGNDAAQGEYFIHVDADDWIETDMCEELYKRAKDTQADIIICDYYKDDGKTCLNIKQEPSSLDPNQVIKDFVRHLEGFCWNKFVRRECNLVNGITFDENILAGGDLYWCISFLKHDVKVDYFPKAFYHYCFNINPNSIVKKIYPYENNLYLLQSITELCRDTGAEETIRIKYEWTLVSQEFYAHRLSSKEFRKHCYYFRKSALMYKHSGIVGKVYNSFLYLSCLGMYSFCYILFNFCLAIGRFIFRKSI